MVEERSPYQAAPIGERQTIPGGLPRDMPSYLSVDSSTEDYRIALRIEALRAASEVYGQIMGPVLSAAVSGDKQVSGLPGEVVAASVLELTDQFVRWLETGER